MYSLLKWLESLKTLKGYLKFVTFQKQMNDTFLATILFPSPPPQGRGLLKPSDTP